MLCGTYVASRSLLNSLWRLSRPARLLGLAGLTSLAAHLLTGVADPFAFVWLGGTHTPYACRLLADQLLVNSRNGQARVSVESICHAIWWGHSHGMREPYRQDEIAPLQGRPIPNALNLQVALV